MSSKNELSVVSVNRKTWIDILKGIGILLVVFGHVIMPDGLPKRIIASFNMPLFFLISGLLFNYEKWSGNFKVFCKEKFIRLMFPYAFTCLILFLLWFTFSVPKPFVWTPLEAILNVLKYAGLGWVYGIGNHNVYSALSFEPVGPIWFLPSCFLGLMMLYWFVRLFGKNIKTLMVGGICLLPIIWFGAYVAKYIFLPWSLDITMVAMAFFCAGYIIRRYNIIHLLSLKMSSIPLLLAIWYVAFNFSHIYMNNRDYSNLWLAIIGAICMCLTIMILLYKYHEFLFSNKFGRAIIYCGMNSMVILCFHDRLKYYMPKTSWVFYNPIVTMCFLVVVCLFIKFIIDHIPRIKKMF